MQLAETQGIPYADVHPQVAGTADVGCNGVTGGSRTTFGAGWAVYELGKKLLAEMGQRATDLWDAPAAEVTVADSVFRHGDQQISFKELAAQLDPPVIASASVHPQD